MTTLLDELGKITKIITHCGVPACAELNECGADPPTAPRAQCRGSDTKHRSRGLVVDQALKEGGIGGAHLELALSARSSSQDSIAQTPLDSSKRLPYVLIVTLMFACHRILDSVR